MSGRTRIKMCGVTNLDDAVAAVHSGVDGLGFIFVESSPRYIDAESARAIIRMLPPFVDTVGVFVDRPMSDVVDLIDFCSLSHVQLHGKEDPDYCRQLSQSCNCMLLKAFRVGPESSAAEFTPYDDVVNGYLLDTYKKGMAGGTGESFDWGMIDNLFLRRPIVLAGGLSVDNVNEAISRIHPFAIDINSTIETEPGRKDHQKLQRLVDQVRIADRESE